MSVVHLSKVIDYPASDGMPMAENTLQFEWIVAIKGSLEWIFRSEPNVFVAGDLLWYPVEGNNKLRTAPDALVAFGRPKGYRGSYMQWLEGGIAPQVVFEVLSPGNRLGEMTRKFMFYNEHRVEEYYVIDPYENLVDGWIRQGDSLQPIEQMDGWVSPRLGIRFGISEQAAVVLHQPDGTPFKTYEQVCEMSELYQNRAQQEAARAEQEAARAERLAAKLRELGVDPDSL